MAYNLIFLIVRLLLSISVLDISKVTYSQPRSGFNPLETPMSVSLLYLYHIETPSLLEGLIVAFARP